MGEASDQDSFLSFGCSVTAAVLLVGNGWYVLGFLFFTCSMYFLKRLWKPAKVVAPDDFRVIIFGAGVSGICMGKKLNDLGIRYTILEKAPALGGTWWENIYPGAACDVPSHLYSYSFFQNPNWSRAYSHQKEILNYLQETASRFGVYPNIKFSQRIKLNIWNKETNKWTVETEGGVKYIGNVIISGCGGLHVPKYPKFPGMDDFKGDAFHTAKWIPDFDPKDKTVAIIGTGASAVQAVPNLSEMGVKSLTVFQRTPCWSPPRLDFEYPEWIKTMFALIPMTNTIHRWFYFWRNEFRFRVIFTRSSWITKKMSAGVHTLVKKHIKHVVKDADLAKKLIPSYDMGCKRITPSDTYLSAFNKENIHLETESIEKFTNNGILTVDGTERTFDTIIYATGFDLEESAKPFDQIGSKGKMTEDYGDAPTAYLGITHPNHPNFFLLLGPGTGLGHNTIIYMIECQANYACDGIVKLINSGAKSMAVKPEVLKNYDEFVQENMKGKVFADNTECTGWYRNAKGVNWTLWPLDLVTYWWYTRSCNMSEYFVKH